VINPGGLLAGGSTAVGIPSAGTGSLLPGSNGLDSSSNLNAPGGRLNALSLVALVPATPNPLATGNEPGPAAGPGASPLNAALGGSDSLATNPSAATLLLAPTPLTVATPLPPIQASHAVLEGTASGSTSGSPTAGLLPQSIPEPGVLALFVIVSLASVMRRIVRRLQSREGMRQPATRTPSLEGHVDVGQ
jgi:hypothetical protein